MAPILRRDNPGNTVIAVTLLGLGIALIIIFFLARKFLMPCIQVQYDTIEAGKMYRKGGGSSKGGGSKGKEDVVVVDDRVYAGKTGKSAKSEKSKKKSGSEGSTLFDREEWTELSETSVTSSST